jgi:hypothetical protein
MKRIPKLLAVLKTLDLLNFNSYVVRKKIQKIVYLLKDFGMNLEYNYSWFIHGPYSIDLTKTMVELTGLTNKSETEK